MLLSLIIREIQSKPTIKSNESSSKVLQSIKGWRGVEEWEPPHSRIWNWYNHCETCRLPKLKIKNYVSSCNLTPGHISDHIQKAILYCYSLIYMLQNWATDNEMVRRFLLKDELMPFAVDMDGPRDYHMISQIKIL